MNAPSNALLALSALVPAAMVAAGGIVLALQAAEPALVRVTSGMFPDCSGSGFEVLGGRDRDRDGALADWEAEVFAVVCNVDGRLELGYEPEALPFDGVNGGRPRPRVIMEIWDEPSGSECAEGGLGISVGVDRDRDLVLSDAEIGGERLFCGVPTAARYARSL